MSFFWIGFCALAFLTVAGGLGLFLGRASGNDTRGKGRKR